MYGRVLEAQPNHPVALHIPGVAAYRKAIAVEPGNVEAYSNLANALGSQGKLEEAGGDRPPAGN